MNAVISLKESVNLGAVDDDFFCQHFFPRTFRQGFPSFSPLIQAAFDDPTSRYVALKMFRGSAKTTRVRARVAKHISYAISNTILLVSNAQKHSIYSLKWLKKQIEYNTLWTNAFGISRGKTWSDEIIEIYHHVAGRSIYVIPLGITGQVRGINLDDFRPDFIVLDDPDNEETTATPEAREKTQALIFGALAKSLAPPTEAPLAKMAVLQTPLEKGDTIDLCGNEPSFRLVTVPCFDPNGESTWPSRFPTKFLLEDKEMHIRLNKLSLWMREMECKIVSKELATFQEGWLRFWEELPDDLQIVICIDPASSDAKGADDQVVMAVGFRPGGDIYVLEYSAQTGEMPDAAAGYVMQLIVKWKNRVRKIAVESISYQRVLAWYIEKTMAAERKWKAVDQVQDKRSKNDRIVQELVGPSANGRLYFHRSQSKLLSQFIEYAPRTKGKVDVLDCLAIGVMSWRGGDTYEGDYDIIADEEKHIPDLDEGWRACP